MLLTSLRITTTAHHHGREPPWRKCNMSIRHGGLTVKMETRHPVGGLFGLEFAAFVIIAEL